MVQCWKRLNKTDASSGIILVAVTAITLLIRGLSNKSSKNEVKAG